MNGRDLGLDRDDVGMNHPDQLHQVLLDGQGQMMSATELSHPPCCRCDEPQSRSYIDLRYTGVGRLVVCIPCANSRRAEGAWDDPDTPRQAERTVHPSKRYRLVPSLDEVGPEAF